LIVVSHNMGKDYANTRMAIGEGAMGLSIKKREAVIVEDYSTWENASPQYVEGTWHAVLAVPIMAGKRVIGSIGMVDLDPQRRFTATDQHLLSLFAHHAAIAVENARLYKTAREAAEKRAILHQVSQAIVAASLEPEGIYEAIHQAAARLMPTEAFAITRYNETEQAVDAVYLVDRGERYPPMQIPANQGIGGRVIQDGKSIYIPDILDVQELGDGIHFGDQDQVRSILAVPMYLRGKVVGMLSAQSYQVHGYTPEDQYLLEMLATYAAIALDNASLFRRIQQLAITDTLTGIFNRRHLFALGQREFLRAKRLSHSLSVIMLDIDHFKQVNDSYGHAAGDHVLHRLAQLLRSAIREIDIIGRYGGEEFTIILPETNLFTAQEIAERLREHVNETFQGADSNPISITVSIGVAEIQEDIPDFTALVAQADTAMYSAKQEGRNRVGVLRA
ncbi:MAG: diguanylate cyclase, partial [Anaerolineales bacterium]|nr:diguanylate cyclase [Anaerolineales bacterium]